MRPCIKAVPFLGVNVHLRVFDREGPAETVVTRKQRRRRSRVDGVHARNARAQHVRGVRIARVHGFDTQQLARGDPAVTQAMPQRRAEGDAVDDAFAARKRRLGVGVGIDVGVVVFVIFVVVLVAPPAPLRRGPPPAQEPDLQLDVEQVRGGLARRLERLERSGLVLRDVHVDALFLGKREAPGGARGLGRRGARAEDAVASRLEHEEHDASVVRVREERTRGVQAREAVRLRVRHDAQGDGPRRGAKGLLRDVLAIALFGFGGVSHERVRPTRHLEVHHGAPRPLPLPGRLRH
mmetsp:Transcript_6406/g.25980  ORF Transcript_6406/g.25980 Transcript_6406/m.25980 type:complete len:294 (-) Transcript_6406:36-917(-)